MTARLDRLLREGPVGVRGHYRAGLVCGILLVAMVFACPVLAAERELDEDPAPGSAEEIKTPGQRVFPEVEERPPLFPWLQERLQTLPTFFADTVLSARYRTYYMRQDRTSGVLSEVWAMGRSAAPLRSGIRGRADVLLGRGPGRRADQRGARSAAAYERLSGRRQDARLRG